MVLREYSHIHILQSLPFISLFAKAKQLHFVRMYLWGTVHCGAFPNESVKFVNMFWIKPQLSRLQKVDLVLKTSKIWLVGCLNNCPTTIYQRNVFSTLQEITAKHDTIFPQTLPGSHKVLNSPILIGKKKWGCSAQCLVGASATPKKGDCYLKCQLLKLVPQRRATVFISTANAHAWVFCITCGSQANSFSPAFRRCPVCNLKCKIQHLSTQMMFILLPIATQKCMWLPIGIQKPIKQTC